MEMSARSQQHCFLQGKRADTPVSSRPSPCQQDFIDHSGVGLDWTFPCRELVTCVPLPQPLTRKSYQCPVVLLQGQGLPRSGGGLNSPFSPVPVIRTDFGLVAQSSRRKIIRRDGTGAPQGGSVGPLRRRAISPHQIRVFFQDFWV